MGLIRLENGELVFHYEKKRKTCPITTGYRPGVRGAGDARDAAHSAALIAARESLVLLKNEGFGNGPVTLPVDINNIRNIVLVGEKIIEVQTTQSPQPTLFQDYDNIARRTGMDNQVAGL